MKIVRVRLDEEMFWGVLNGDTVKRLKGEPYEELLLDGREYSLEKVVLSAPALPSKVVCVGKNYYDHCEELKDELGDEAHPQTPILFIKPSTSIIGNGDIIKYPSVSNRVDYEAELAIVIKKEAKNVKKENAHEYILGYTCLNDVTARDIQKKEGQWTRAKSMDTFCPIGPFIETEFDANEKRITARLNGETKQDSNTSLMMHKVDSIIEFITSTMTLLKGDIIATGTPSGIGEMKKGDVIEIEIEGIGTLKNTVG